MSARQYSYSPLPIVVSSTMLVTPVVITPIVCRFASPLPSEQPMVGVGFLITGVLTRPGTVAIAGLGAATVTGLTWWLLWTPASGDIGSRTLTAIATDASNGTTSTVSVTCTVAASAAYPTIATPAVWYDGRQQAWADAGATVQAIAPTDRVQRVDEPTPLTGSWTAPTTAERPLRDAAGLRFEALGTAGGYQLQRPDPGGIYRDACTLIVAFVARDNAFAGPLTGLLEETTQYTGIEIGSNVVTVRTASGVQSPGSLTVAQGKLNVIAVTYTPTGGTVKLDAGGVVTTATFTATASHTATGAWNIGRVGGQYEYCSMTQALVIPNALNSTDLDAAMAWVKAQPAPQAYPDDHALLTWVGDSITRSTGANYNNCFASLTLSAVRAAGYPAENCNVAVGGSGVNQLLDPTTGAAPNGANKYRRAKAFYSATRLKNVMIFALGTNNLAGDNAVSYVLNGVGFPNGASNTDGSGLYPAIDDAVAQGWRVVVVCPGPRTDNASFQATYDARRTQVCDDLVANGPSHGAIVVDTRNVVNFGGPTDSNNPAYYSSDKIHPVDAGHALVAPAIYAAVLAAIAA